MIYSKDDVKRILDEVLKRYYGPKAEAMEKIIEKLKEEV